MPKACVSKKMKGGMSKKAAMKACYPERGSKKEHQKSRELGQKLYPGGRKPESQLKEKFHKKTKKNPLVKRVKKTYPFKQYG